VCILAKASACSSFNASRKEVIFAFDLDGTLTLQEILPVIGALAGIEAELAALTRQTLTGAIDFAESFRLRFNMLRAIPSNSIATTVSKIPLNQHLLHFIRTHREQCRIVTGNLDNWIHPLVRKFRCQSYCSHSHIGKNGSLELASILDKGEAIQHIAAGHPEALIVSIGESMNDLPMFLHSDIRIAYAGVHEPVPELVAVADYMIGDGQTLCRILEHFARSASD